jgi:tetratricopeptide (TPR) repeat protein
MLERITAVAGVGLLVLAALACGGDGEPAPAEPPVRTPAPASPLQQLEDEVRRNPDNPESLHTLAVALHHAGRRDEALEHLEKLVQIKPDARHLIELGVAYASVSRPAEAEDAFNRALEKSIGHPVALHHLANLARTRGDTAGAISLYRQAVESDPEYLMAHFHLAEALRESRQLEEAYRSYERVVNLRPEVTLEVQAFDAALLQLAGLDLQMGAPERAVEFLNVLVEAVPDHATAHFLLGQALMALNREEEARQQLEIHQTLAARRTGTQPTASDPDVAAGIPVN